MLKSIVTHLKIFRKPSYVRILARNAFRANPSPSTDREHLDATMRWLCRAQDVTGCGGVSGVFFLHKGWTEPYPETTGYIIPTFLRYAALGNGAYRERAVQMGDWEIKVQLPSGAVRGGIGVNDYPIVFNTGQVILGWAALYKDTRETRFLDAAARAADWLVSVQDPDGKWGKFTHRETLHAYKTRVAWALSEVYDLTNEQKYKNAAQKFINWVIGQAKGNGWFEHMGFDAHEPPLTHTIAYTLQGLMKSQGVMEEQSRRRIFDLVSKASDEIIRRYNLDQPGVSLGCFLSGTFNDQWEAVDTFACLTGNAQFAIIWLDLYTTTKDKKLRNAAHRLIEQVKSAQCLDLSDENIRGGIAGAYPIWGNYIRFGYPNWAAKFFADALMLKESLRE